MDLGGLYRALASLSPPRDRDSLLSVLHAAMRAGTLPPEMAEYVRSTVDLPELQVRNSMVPRVDVIALPDTTSVAEAARTMAEHGHRRLPVFHETIDRPVGVVHALDVARALAGQPDGAARKAGELARPTPQVSQTLPLLEAIQAMRSQATHLLLVMDEHGGFAGLTTLEDIMDYLLGPIPDEYGEPGRVSIRVVDAHEAIVGGAASLKLIERMLKLRFPPGRYVSIGGLIYDRLQRVPRRGDVVHLPGMRIEVLSVEGAKVRDVRIRTGPGVSPDGSLLDLGLGKEVMCGTDQVGHVERLITDHATGRVTAFVVQSRGRPVVVPLELVERTDEGVVYLKPAGCDLDQLAQYHLPEITERTEVVGRGGPLGKTEHLVLDPTSRVATHVVVRLTGSIPPRSVVVPLSWARSVTPERIELIATRAELDELPEYRADDEIEADLLRKIFEDERFQGVDRYTLKVDATAGAVRLTGRVRTTGHKLAAEELARSTRGVLAVLNELIADDELALSVQHALRASGLRLDALDVSALLGKVKLRGIAATQADRESAARIAQSVAGVQSVANDLSVTGAPVPQ